MGFIWSLRCLLFLAFGGVLGVGLGFNRTGEIWRFGLFFFNGRGLARGRVRVWLCVHVYDSKMFGLEQGIMCETLREWRAGHRLVRGTWFSGACMKRYHCFSYEMQRAIVD